MNDPRDIRPYAEAMENALVEWARGVYERLRPLFEELEASGFWEKWCNDPEQLDYEIDLDDPTGAEEWDVFV